MIFSMILAVSISSYSVIKRSFAVIGGGQMPVGFALTVLAAVVSDFRRLLSDGESH